MTAPPSAERLAEMREWLRGAEDAGRFMPIGEEMARDLLAEVDRLRAQAADEAVCRRANSASARALMDAIRDDPAFPPENDPALFGERALAVIDRLRAQVAGMSDSDADGPDSPNPYRASGDEVQS